MIEKTLGEGTFGKVAKCFDKKRAQSVALKIIKNIERCQLIKHSIILRPNLRRKNTFRNAFENKNICITGNLITVKTEDVS